jgi:hypothetical protein
LDNLKLGALSFLLGAFLGFVLLFAINAFRFQIEALKQVQRGRYYYKDTKIQITNVNETLF